MIYTNVMLDLETMGNGSDAAIVAIGAVAFDITAGELGPAYYNRVDLASSVAGGGVMDPSTVTWWLKQSEEAHLEIARDGGMHIAEALQSFAAWMNECVHDAAVWGNGASFDNVILRSAYARNGTSPPWAWWNDRCYRTVKAMPRDVPMERLGTHHNAMSDAISQARHLIKMLTPPPGAAKPECNTCANRGLIDGLSQETHCDHCSHQQQGRRSHYVPVQTESGNDGLQEHV